MQIEITRSREICISAFEIPLAEITEKRADSHLAPATLGDREFCSPTRALFIDDRPAGCFAKRNESRVISFLFGKLRHSFDRTQSGRINAPFLPFLLVVLFFTVASELLFAVQIVDRDYSAACEVERADLQANLTKQDTAHTSVSPLTFYVVYDP